MDAEIAAAALVAEDERLSASQAGRIARQLDRLHAGGVSRHANGNGRTAVGPEPPVSPPVIAHLRSAIEADLDPSHLMRRVVGEALALVPLADGAAIDVLEPGGADFRCVCATGALTAEEGTTHPAGVGVAARALTTALPLRSSTAGGSVLCVPLLTEAGLTGLLRVTSSTPAAFSDDDELIFDLVGRFVTAALAGSAAVMTAAREILGERHRPGELAVFVARTLGPAMERHVRRATASERIREVMSGGDLRMVYQPMSRLDTGVIVGYEALARFHLPPPRSPEQWFAEATGVGLGIELEMLAVERALADLDRLPEGTFLSVNVSPNTAASARFKAILQGVPLERLVIEITEHAPVDDYAALGRALDALRREGARLAIDDAGAGFASLRHVLRLTPDMIKLDVSLTRRIDTDPVRRALATSLIGFAGEVGATILAEGIETRWEVDALVKLGVRYGQGFHLARPAPLP